jgi:hypothetical protein
MRIGDLSRNARITPSLSLRDERRGDVYSARLRRPGYDQPLGLEVIVTRPACACLCGAALLAACQGTPLTTAPSAPGQPATTTSPSAFPSVPVPTFTVTGIVTRAENGPIAGAKIVAMNDALFVAAPTSRPVHFVETDADGHYRIDGVAYSSNRSESTMVGALKTGYFADFKWLQIAEDRQLDFELEPWAYVAVGDTVRSRIGEARCAGLGYGGQGGAYCQRFAISPTTSGTLNVTLTAPVFDFDVDVVMPDGTFGKYIAGARSPLQFSVPVETGLTYEIRLAAIGQAREFELATTLR